MGRRRRILLSRVFAITGALALLAAAATALRWNASLGTLAEVSGYNGQLRFEYGSVAYGGMAPSITPSVTAAALTYRAHPWGIQVFRLRGRLIVEVGAAPLCGLAVLLFATAGALKWSTRPPRGGCRHCGYDIRGLPTGGACPECGLIPSAATPSRVPSGTSPPSAPGTPP